MTAEKASCWGTDALTGDVNLYHVIFFVSDGQITLQNRTARMYKNVSDKTRDRTTCFGKRHHSNINFAELFGQSRRQAKLGCSQVRPGQSAQPRSRLDCRSNAPLEYA